MNMNTFVAYEICPRNTICNKYIISKKWNIIKVKLLVKHFIDRLYRGYHTILSLNNGVLKGNFKWKKLNKQTLN